MNDVRVQAVKLDAEQQQAANVIIGECINALLRLLASRRRTVVVRRVLKETAYFQCIALGGLWLRTMEQYPPEVQAEIRRHAEELASLMARPEV